MAPVDGFNAMACFAGFSNADFYLCRLLQKRVKTVKAAERFSSMQTSGLAQFFCQRADFAAQACANILRTLAGGSMKERLRALQEAALLGINAFSLPMPLNTARVLLALAQKIVSGQESRQRQLEWARDFLDARFGWPRSVRRCLKKLQLIEVPETGRPLKELGLGFDFDACDNLSYSRKNASSLLLDAYIKGISQLTLASDSFDNRDAIYEALEAGRILGIEVQAGLRFAVREDGRRACYMAVLPPFADGEAFNAFYARFDAALQPLNVGIKQNLSKRRELIKNNLDRFNQTYLPAFNEGYAQEDFLCRLAPLAYKDLEEVAALNGASLTHLGDLLYKKYSKVLFNRIIMYQSRLAAAREQEAQGLISEWDCKNLERRYHDLRRAYETLNPEELRLKYFASAVFIEAGSALASLKHAAEIVHGFKGKVRLLSPLSLGLEGAISLLRKYAAYIDEVEIYCLGDSYNRPVEEVIALAKRIQDYNEKNQAKRNKGFKCVCGSGFAGGRAASLPDFGFIFEDRLSLKNRKEFSRGRVAAPAVTGALIAQGMAQEPDQRKNVLFSLAEPLSERRLADSEAIGLANNQPVKALAALKPVFFLFWGLVLGFAAAFAFLPPLAALFWQAAFAARATAADLFFGKGRDFRSWTFKSVNKAQLGRGLLFSGLTAGPQFFLLNLLGWQNLPWLAALLCGPLSGLLWGGYFKAQGQPHRFCLRQFFIEIAGAFLAASAAALGLAGLPFLLLFKLSAMLLGLASSCISGFKKLASLYRLDLKTNVAGFSSARFEDQALAALDTLYQLSNGVFSGFFLEKELDAPSSQYAEALAWFQNKANWPRLHSFILERYAQDDAFFLSNLILQAKKGPAKRFFAASEPVA